MRLLYPVPFTDLLAPEYTKRRGDRNYDFAYAFADAEGMPGGPGGARVHGGTDMFGPGNSPVIAPMDGVIVRADHSTDVSGPVFGGVLAIESPQGHAVLFRHVNPLVPVGAHVRAGDEIARITAWRDGWPHAHTEIYRFWPASYHFANTVDPRSVEWAEDAPVEQPVADFYFEELPHTEGGLGPAVVWHGRGSPVTAVALHKARGRIVSTVRDADGVSYVYWWKPGTYPRVPIFGPWVEEAARDAWLKTREANTGRTMRPYRGRHRSRYPIPA